MNKQNSKTTFKLFVCLSLVFSMCFNFGNNKPAEAATGRERDE
ncbi:hypothetical protein [Paenibacillus sp. B2(2019)]|nr:hypothetical protein [Paenibacillus sp. B2(2019)]